MYIFFFLNQKFFFKKIVHLRIDGLNGIISMAAFMEYTSEFMIYIRETLFCKE